VVQQLPEATAERRPSWYQRSLRWLTWLTFLGAAVLNSDQASFGAVELLLLALAIGVSIWCVARPLGGPKLDLTEPAHVLGEFVSRTNWALVLIGALLTIGGFAGGAAAVYDLSTGRADLGDVFRDIGIFIEGWFVEIFTQGWVDAELEKTHGYALVILLVAGVPVLLFNLGPLLHRGRSFRVGRDGAVEVSAGTSWIRLEERDFATVSADGAVIRFELGQREGEDGGTITLGQRRMFSREQGARLPAEVSAAFFRERLAARGFDVTEGVAGSFTARRG
jgi:hypothetical protein